MTDRTDGPDDRAFEAAWKACSSWDGKITKPVLRKAIAAAIKETRAAALEDAADRIEALEAALEEPYGYVFQHEETGLTQVVDAQQIEWDFEGNNPRWHKIGPVYLHPDLPVEVIG